MALSIHYSVNPHLWKHTTPQFSLLESRVVWWAMLMSPIGVRDVCLVGQENSLTHGLWLCGAHWYWWDRTGTGLGQDWDRIFRSGTHWYWLC